MAFWSSLLKRNPRLVVADTETEVKRIQDALNFPNIIFNTDDGKKIAAIMICSKILAQDIGRLPLKIFRTDESGNKTILVDDNRYLLLHNHPNSYTDAFTFWSTVEFIRSSEGNAYVRIHRDELRKPVSLEIITNDKIEGPAVVSGELYYGITEDGKDTQIINSSEILHFRNLSSNGIKGRDPKVDLNINLSISYKALTTIDNFYNNGAISTKALETVIPEGINPIEWQNKIIDFNSKYQSYLNANKTIVLPPFTKLTDLNVNFADAQFIDTIKYNNGQVASYYGIPQHKIGNIESSKFNTLSDLQMDYVSNTIAPIITMYRRELELKLLSDNEILNGYSIEFESGALLMTDSKTRMENYKNLFGLGAITPNKVAQLENLPAYEGGNDHYLMSNYMSVEKYNQKNTNPQIQA
jgi:HK97 family phage portal protein